MHEVPILDKIRPRVAELVKDAKHRADVGLVAKPNKSHVHPDLNKPDISH